MAMVTNCCALLHLLLTASGKRRLYCSAQCRTVLAPIFSMPCRTTVFGTYIAQATETTIRLHSESKYEAYFSRVSVKAVAH